MTFRHGVTVTVLPRRDHDKYGDPVDATTGARTIRNCGIAPRTEPEIVERGRTGVVVGLTLIAPTDAGLHHLDRLMIDDAAYPGVWEVDGEPAIWRSPMTGWNAGMQAALRHAEG